MKFFFAGAVKLRIISNQQKNCKKLNTKGYTPYVDADFKKLVMHMKQNTLNSTKNIHFHDNIGMKFCKNQASFDI